jgi:integrase
MAAKPKIPNVWWRGEWAWGRIEVKGRDIRDPLNTKDPRIARQRVQQWIEGLKATKWGEKPRRTYDEAANRFIDEHLPRLKGGLEGRTAKGYLTSLEKLSTHFAKARVDKLDEIDSGKLSEYEQIRRMQGVTSGTIRNDLWVLSSLFTRAQEWDWIVGNPVAAYIRHRAKHKLLMPQPARTRYCSHEEERTLLERCRGSKTVRNGSEEIDHTMLAAGIILTVDIGLRKEELLGGDWTMVDLRNNEWTVPKELAKSGKARTVPILPRSQAVLRSLPRSKAITSVLWHSERGEDDRYTDLLPALLNIATGGRSRILRREMTKLSMRKAKVTDKHRAEIAAMAEAGAWADEIPDLIWHDLRRTCGCRLLQDMGLSMEQVSKWLGHSSVKVTEKAYAFLEVKHLHEAAGTLPAPDTSCIDSRSPFEALTIPGISATIDDQIN